VSAAEEDGIGERSARFIALYPFVLVGLFSLGIAFPPTRRATLWMLLENRPVELLTFVMLVIAGVRGLVLAGAVRKAGRGSLAFYFFLAFSLGLLAIGGEEFSWGQKFFGFDTPEGLKEVNPQGELTLHNVGAMQEYLEVFPLVFGLGGLAGLVLSRFPGIRDICPPRILLPAFLVIAGISAIDLVHEFVILHPKLDNLINDLDEVIELLIAISAFFFVSIGATRFSPCDSPEFSNTP